MNTRVMLVVFIAFIAIVWGCSRQSEQGTTDTSGIMKAYQQRVDGIDNGDPNQWLSAFAADVRFVAPEKPDVVGIDALKAWGQPYFDNYILDSNETIYETEVSGHLAFIRYTFNASLRPKSEGEANQWSGKGILLFKRQDDNTWRITHNIWSDDPKEAK